MLGVHATLWLGRTVPVPAPVNMLQDLDSIEVTHSDSSRSLFQIVFRVGRSRTDVLDYALASSPLLQPCSRVLLTVTFNGAPKVLLDGIVTHQQLSPRNEPGATLLTVTGEDVSVMMDLEEKSVEHPAQNETVIAAKIIAEYAAYGMIPKVIPPPSLDIPIPTERTPVQQDTDFGYLVDMAQRYAYVFYVAAGPAPLTNTAYWGPPERIGLPQRALSVNMGPNSNVKQIDFSHDGQAAERVVGNIHDRDTHQSVPVQSVGTTRVPLAAEQALTAQQCVRTRRFRDTALNATQALTRAQARSDASADQTVTARGTLDAENYGGLLTPRGLVGLRGAGLSYDGLFYVKEVTHRIARGDYTQNFTLTREGRGTTTPVVVP